ncbi:MAG: PEP-CTERM sorting domain-containing protein, partial [Planctomycetota bacterium]
SADRNPIYLVEADAGAMAADRESVWFRMQAVSEPGSAVSSISRLDNIFIEGTVVPAPGALALLGLAGVASRRRRR